MKPEQLLQFFEMHKDGIIHVWHPWAAQVPNAGISLNDLFRMFEIVREKRDNSVHQD